MYCLRSWATPVFLIVMHLFKAYARSTTTDIDRFTSLKYRTKTKKAWERTIISLGGGGGRGLRNFLLQVYFFNICAASIIFFQSHHLENNFYPDFFFGAKTINILSILALCYL